MPEHGGRLRESARLRVIACLAAGFMSLTLASTALAAGAVQSASSTTPPPASSEDVLAELTARFARVYGAVEENFVEPVNPDAAILDGAIRHALATLDPFSAFFDRDQFKLLGEQTRGQGLGFGSILYVQPGKVLVLETAQGSPAWRAGLGPGDEIVEVNGTRLAGLDFDSLVALLQQSRSGPVRLGVIHPGKIVAQDFELKPAEVALPSLDKVFQLNGGIGYLHIASFESKTPEEVARAIDKLEGASGATASADGAKGSAPAPAIPGLLLDLRDNHGGLIDAAIGVASLFLPPGSRVLTIRARAGEAKTYTTFAAKKPYSGPLVVLVNGETASASEVLAAALEEHDRATIAGEPTYGKGVVESLMPLSEQTGLALTTGEYLTPSGRSLQRPLAGTALQKLSAGHGSDFHTDNGRPLAAAGGVNPDVLIPPRSLDPWLAFLDQHGAFTDFAASYLTLHQRPPRSFAPDAGTLGDFKDFLARNGIRAPDRYWDRDQDYLKLRIRTEVISLVYGLAAGDEVAATGDPQVQRALDLFPTVGALLRASRQAEK